MYRLLCLGVATAVCCWAASITSELRAEGLSFVELGAFGKMEIFDPTDAFPRTKQLPDSEALVGVSSSGDKLLLLADSHRVDETPDKPKIYDEINVATLSEKLIASFSPKPAIRRMLAYSAELSPDGESVVFLGNFLTPQGQGGYGMHLLARSGEFRTLVATSEAKTPQSAAWSSDGRTIVYDLEGRIFLYRLGTNTISPLVNGSRPTWSPNGMWIAYRTPGGTAALITRDGSSVRHILGSVKLGWGLRWSPDSRYLLYTDADRREIRVLDVLTGETETIVAPFDRNETEVHWRWVRK
jgi:Tol biopolymer transport system component